MRFYKLNVQESEKIYELCRDLIELKMCYNNVANVVLNHYSLFKIYKGIQIAYGGVSLAPALEGAYAKHCFFIYEDMVIDPTAMFWDKDVQARDYVIARTFDFGEYIDNVSRSDGDASLEVVMRKPYRDLMIELQKDGKILVG